ncbi:MAG: class I SAM-dependent methyltransferase, partial [Acidimicrobiales bacterium]
MEQVAECLALLPYVPRGKALDFGAVTGRLSFALAAHFKSVTCVDASPSMRTLLLQRAQARGIQTIEVIPSEALPAPGHAF